MSATLYREFTLRNGGIWAAVVAFVKANAPSFAEQGTPLRLIVTACIYRRRHRRKGTSKVSAETMVYAIAFYLVSAIYIFTCVILVRVDWRRMKAEEELARLKARQVFTSGDRERNHERERRIRGSASAPFLDDGSRRMGPASLRAFAH